MIYYCIIGQLTNIFKINYSNYPMRASGQNSSQVTTGATIAVSSKGRKRIVEIMEACKTVLIDKGYTQFSLRNIAREAGIHLSNLQYYFRTRDELVKGLIDYNNQHYFQKFAERFATLPAKPYPRFLAMIDYLIEDIRDPLTRRFFIQFWALLEASGAHTGRLLNDMYALYIQALNQHIAELNPLLSPGVRQQRAAMIAAMIEGMMLMLEEADNDLKEGDAGIEMEMRNQIIRIATDP